MAWVRVTHEVLIVHPALTRLIRLPDWLIGAVFVGRQLAWEYGQPRSIRDVVGRVEEASWMGSAIVRARVRWTEAGHEFAAFLARGQATLSVCVMPHIEKATLEVAWGACGRDRWVLMDRWGQVAQVSPHPPRWDE